MTIPNYARALNDRLTNLERCAEIAPEGTYEMAKQAALAVSEASNAVMFAIRDCGFKVKNNDSLRALEAMIYGYLLDSNPEHSGLIVAEGFGEHVDGPAGERVLMQAIRDRDALERAQT